VRKALEDAVKYSSSNISIQTAQKNMKEISGLITECDKDMTLSKNIIEIRLESDIKDNDGKIKNHTAELIEDHKEDNSDIYKIDLIKMNKRYKLILEDVINDKNYFVEYKTLLGSKVNE